MIRSLIIIPAAAIALTGVAATSAQADTTPHVHFPSDCETNVYQPKQITVTCADANFALEGIAWKRYGERTAHGRATAVVNDCKPTCAAGTFKEYPHATVTLSRVRQCGLVPQFTRLKVRFHGTPPKGFDRVERQSFRCANAPS